MIKKIKAFIAVGGTGGHVFPGCNLAEFLIQKNYEIKLITDKRGKKYLKKYEHLDINILPSTPIINKNVFHLFISLVSLFYSILRSLIFLIFNRPQIIFGMGGYASFPICIAARILRIKLIIYENNLVIGKANKYLMPYANKVFVSYKELEGIPQKYQSKTFETGNIIKKEIINFTQQHNNNKDIKSMKILVLGGSQAAKIFAAALPEVFHKCLKEGVPLKIFQQCLPGQNEQLKSFYLKNGIESEIFNFSDDITEYFSKVNLAISRSGSSMLAELTNAKIPFISVPLPSSADNHQFKNAIFYKKKIFSFLIEEKDLKDKLYYLIKEIHKNTTMLDKIIQNMGLYSDKNVYIKIDKKLKEIFNEKN